MLPYIAYKYVKNQQNRNRTEMSQGLAAITQNLQRSIVPDNTVLRIPFVNAIISEEPDGGDFVPGALSIVEKSYGVFIEWFPAEESPDSSGWVVADAGEGDNDEHSLISTSPTGGSINQRLKEEGSKLQFSLDVNDLSSFRNFEPKKGKGYPSIRLICKDGTNYIPLQFRSTSTAEFVDVLQRYVTLRRSAREPNLVLVVDEKAEALAQSVCALDQNQDILARFVSNPYAAAMTGFGKITAFVQDQVIPTLLDSDEVSMEEQIRAMRELRMQEGGGEDIRTYRDGESSDFEMVTQLELPPRPEIFREQPVTRVLWDKCKKADGSFDMQKVHHLKMNVFRGGLEPALRREAWKYLLGYCKWEETPAEHAKNRIQMEKDYYRMKSQWESITGDQETRFLTFSNRKALVEKDVARTDRTIAYFQGDENANLHRLHCILMTYCMYNFDLGYVQGMSDFCSPLLFVLEDEVDAFWCFVELMNIVHRNFEEDQSSIKMQLNQLRDLVMIINPKLANYLESHQSDDMYFCFRWVLVWFKREFSFEDTSKLWEVIWTRQPCPNFHLLVCVAILDKQMHTIIENKFGLTEILKHVNDLSMHLKLDEVLTSAEAIFHQLSASQDKLPSHICEYLCLGDQTPTEERK